MNIADLMAMNVGEKKPAFADEPTETQTVPTGSGEEFDTFLRLLTAQIENQDPLAPLESTQFVEQLATFSGLELQAKANNILEDIALMLAQQTYGPPTPASAETDLGKS